MIKNLTTNEKLKRYIGFIIGFLITLIILYINSNTIEYGFFASKINDTTIYNIFYYIIYSNDYNYYHYHYDHDHWNYAYLLWFICLFISIGISWKIRSIIGNIIFKLLKKIDKKM